MEAFEYLPETSNYKNLGETDKRIFHLIFDQCIIHGKITTSNKDLSEVWKIPIRSLARSLKNLKEAQLVDTEFFNVYDHESQKWYCKERSIFLNKIAFPYLSKDNIFTADELIKKHFFDNQILIVQTKERIRQLELLEQIMKDQEKGDMPE